MMLADRTGELSSSAKKAAVRFESGNNGFANRDVETLCTDWHSTYDDSEDVLTPQLTPDPDLAMVVEVLDALPEHVRTALRAIVEAAVIHS
jgi:hypothetical protein